MSKTTYVDGNPAEGVPGTIVTADFLNEVNNHYHTGRDVDGEGALAYAADAGAADAYVVSLAPPLDAYITGMPITFKATYANTGPSTINVNELGAKTIKKNGGEDLSIGDILAGQILAVVYDGTNFQLMKAGAVAPVRDTVRNLVMANNSTNPAYQVDINVDEVILQDGDGNPARMNLSMTIDLTVSGAGGLDTGSEAVSTWYHIWAIMKRDGTKSAIFSAHATAPTLPSGFVYKAYLGACYNASNGNIVWFKQRDRRVVCPIQCPLSAGTATSWTAVSLASIIPSTAKKVNGTFEQDIANQTLIASEVSDFTNQQILQVSMGASSIVAIVPFDMPIITAQTMYYYNLSGGSRSYIYVSGWEY